MSAQERRVLVCRDISEEAGSDGHMDIGMLMLHDGETAKDLDVHLDDDGFWSYPPELADRDVGEANIDAFEGLFELSLEPGEKRVMVIETYYSWEIDDE